ncbi:MAG: 30S ribosomal protein S6 [Rickettsiaceae bacterium]|nr:30S ribosomal protein S6 [Rickettsiaceae bacterium]MDP4832412.1 30S ribosomal protein S6 [Rickettsiaceae bacterium]MDP5020141.1 30S ribosomal protein S6 [Rickettsiaceae bacterium]MDP5082761.1 30S ribosomal protein S6 [Rickettsiaceae bacterium]
MAFYESIIIIRQDVSSIEVDKLANDFAQIVKDHDGTVIKTEYWGLKQLAYEIENNKKGHYYFMGIEANNVLLAEMDRKLKLSESVIRSSLIRVDEISKDPSPILKAKSSDGEETVDVTTNKSSPRISKDTNNKKD